MVAPGWRTAVEGRVKIVDDGNSVAEEEIGGIEGAVMLADANMKRDLEVNDLEISSGDVDQEVRGRLTTQKMQ